MSRSGHPGSPATSGPPGTAVRGTGTTAVAAHQPPSLARRRREAAAPAALVSLALLGVNVLAYVMTVVAARLLVPGAYSELAALLGVMFIGAVPATGLQTAAALTLGRTRAADRPVVLARLHATSWIAASVVAVVGLLAVAPLVRLLHLSGWSTMLWLLAVLVPHALVGGYDGALQGTRRYSRLAFVNTAFGLLKSGGGIIGLIVGGTPESALIGMALGCIASAYIGWLSIGRPGFAPGVRIHVLSATKASGALLGLVLLANLDLLLARHHLPPQLAGEYAVASIFAKLAFWLPQGISVVLLPRLAHAGGRRRLLPIAAAVVALVGAVLTAATAVLGAHALPLVGGAEYGEALGGATWVFAMLGTLFALAQLLLYSGIASSDRIAAVAVWGAVALEAVGVAVLAAEGRLTVLNIAWVATGASLLLVGTGLLRLWRAHSGAAVEPHGAPAH